MTYFEDAFFGGGMQKMHGKEYIFCGHGKFGVSPQHAI